MDTLSSTVPPPWMTKSYWRKSFWNNSQVDGGWNGTRITAEALSSPTRDSISWHTCTRNDRLGSRPQLAPCGWSHRRRGGHGPRTLRRRRCCTSRSSRGTGHGARRRLHPRRLARKNVRGEWWRNETKHCALRTDGRREQHPPQQRIHVITQQENWRCEGTGAVLGCTQSCT
jgi:hypothetical protein